MEQRAQKKKNYGFGDSQATHRCALDLFRTMQIEHSHSDVADGGARPAATQLNPGASGGSDGVGEADDEAEGADDGEEGARGGGAKDGSFPKREPAPGGGGGEDTEDVLVLKCHWTRSMSEYETGSP